MFFIVLEVGSKEVLSLFLCLSVHGQPIPYFVPTSLPVPSCLFAGSSPPKCDQILPNLP